MIHANILTEIIDVLSSKDCESVSTLNKRGGRSLPSAKSLNEIVDLCRSILFPGYFGNSTINPNTIKYHIGVNVEKLYKLLNEQIEAGLYVNENVNNFIEPKKEEVNKRASQFITNLPIIKELLNTDVKAAYNGDPAAENYGEVICCYPAIKAITNHRIAHELFKLDVPVIPRIISEMAHSETGIDIHPAAQIGSHFTIDHGTGVVIGATSIIENNVKLYQGVTLGAKSFPLDENGNPVKGIPRHPILQDDVIVYSNASILGRITIGKGAIIGGNIWVTGNVEPGARIIQKR